MSMLKKLQISLAMGAICAAAGPLAATAANANASANTAATEITKPIEEAKNEGLAAGDGKFRDLFSKWVELDTANPDEAIDFNVDSDFMRSTAAVPSGMPVPGSQLTSGYGMRGHPILRRRKMHSGIDLAAPTGTPVYATADGIIGRANYSSSYGLVIYLDHSDDLQTRYAHLSRLSVAKDQRVRKGDLIGYVGSTGRSTGPHLHYEVRVGGGAVNPMPYIKGSTQTASAGDRRLTGQGGR